MGVIKKCINEVRLSGKVIDSKPRASHKQGDTVFYEMRISIRRKSNVEDIIPIVFTNDILDICGNYKGWFIKVVGSYCSRNKRVSESKSKLILQVMADTITFIDNPPYYGENNIELEGTVCKTPVYRETPYGKEITDVLITSSTANMKPNYIPCICWGAVARWAGGLEVGDKIYLNGRIQSREYHKGEETRIAYEVSVGRIEEITDEES